MVAWNQGIQDKTIQCCGFAKTTQEDKAKMSFSCQHGCTSGTPFMFNWTHPAMPGTFKIEKLRSQCFDTTFTYTSCNCRKNYFNDNYNYRK